MDIPIISHYSRLLNVPISKAFQYYSDVESSQIRYPDYCMKVEIVGEAPDNSIRTKGLWNISLSNDIDHIVAYITYTFLQPTVLTLIGIGIGALKILPQYVNKKKQKRLVSLYMDKIKDATDEIELKDIKEVILDQLLKNRISKEHYDLLKEEIDSL